MTLQSQIDEKARRRKEIIDRNYIPHDDIIPLNSNELDDVINLTAEITEIKIKMERGEE